jgi:hypothetical protein
MRGPLVLGPLSGAIVRQHHIYVRDISRHGALFESTASIRPGAVGMLQVLLEGRAHIEVFRVNRALTVPGSGTWRIGVEFLPIVPPGDTSLRVAVAGFEAGVGTPPSDGLKSGAPMTSGGVASAHTSDGRGERVDFAPFPGDLAAAHGEVITGNPVAHPGDQPITPRRKTPIEEDR